jgi:hypothetical protein
VRIPDATEIPELDRKAIEDDVAPYRGLSSGELDEVRHALCRLAAEQWARWPERARRYQEPLSPESEALWRRLVQKYRARQADERSGG